MGCRMRMLSVVAVALGVVTGLAHGQSSSRGAMVIDDGQTSRVLLYSEPDLEVVRLPDFEASDLPVFAEKLRLSEAQRDVVRRLIEEYLEAYARLVELEDPERAKTDVGSTISGALRAVRGPQPLESGSEESPKSDSEKDREDEGIGGGAMPSGDAKVDPVEAIILDELKKAGFETETLEDSPFRPSISISVSMERPAEGEEASAPAEPGVNVRLSFGKDDDSLTAEMREKLQAVADRAVPRIKEHVRSNLDRMIAPESAAPPPDDQIEEKWAEVQGLHERVKSFLAAKKALRQQYVLKTQAILAEVQLELWPGLERALTRMKTLSWGQLDGERTDLLAILQRMEFSQDEVKRLAEHLESYELQLHQALVRRNEILADVDAQIDSALYEGKRERALGLADRVTKARMAIRDLNERYAEVIAGRLSGERVPRFRGKVLEMSYPRVYRRTLGRQAFDEALALEGLDADVRATIDARYKSYMLQLDEMNRRLARAIREEQPKELTGSVKRAAAMMEGEAYDLAARDAARREIIEGFRGRRELDVRTMRSVYSMLTAEQRARLPRIPVVDVAEPVTAEDADE